MQVSWILWDRDSRIYPNANPQENKAQAIERDHSPVHLKNKEDGEGSYYLVAPLSDHHFRQQQAGVNIVYITNPNLNNALLL